MSYKFVAKEKKPDDLFTLFGELIGCLIVLTIYLSVPVIIFLACLKVLFY